MPADQQSRPSGNRSACSRLVPPILVDLFEGFAQESICGVALDPEFIQRDLEVGYLLLKHTASLTGEFESDAQLDLGLHRSAPFALARLAGYVLHPPNRALAESDDVVDRAIPLSADPH